METWSRSVKPGEDPCPQLLHQTGTSNDLNSIGLRRLKQKSFFSSFFWVVPHHVDAAIRQYSIFFGGQIPSYEEKKSKPGGGLGGADGSTRRRREVNIVRRPLGVKEGGLGGDKGM